ncbi:sensor histidine kinase [Paenibacillus psychroresistens]|uniref:histidine kinase n=1 Tax=Paenibacillus psychroresistens TaxID=1778678 RepID=A0A6B8RIX0_9BACL|nr:HAMP domain-containing sensor histidine kinase [Paenibacillus psychroresistens]QGQ95493.1 sensor histidine kinase [Paenibacillus psychroresistens]
MSIRVRLLLSYLAMLLIPLFLLIIGVVIVVVAFFGDLRGLYHFDFRQQNPLATFIQQQEEVFTEIKQLASLDPESLISNETKLASWNRRLKEINMGMVVEKNDEVVYSSPSINKPAFLEAVKSMGERKADESQLTRNFIEQFFVSSHYDFKYADQSKGSVFIVTDVNPLGKFAGKYLFILVISLLLILLITNGLLTYFVSRSIVRPLKALKRAAEQIKEGNLDYVVKSNSKDEIGELFMAFEQMRGKLKYSVDLQLQYEENRKELISNISHDLKTPVTSIKGYVEGILDGVADTPDKLDKYIKTIYAKATDMDRLIDELFLFSKLDLHNVPFHFEKVDLVRFLEDCTEELQFDFNEKGILLSLDLPKNAAFQVAVDREKLKRVVLNILENSVKYMEQPQGLITIRLTDQEEWVLIQIQDNGQGIADEALPHIFERFYRADPSRNSKTGGSGLGLAIVKQIIEGHGGEIRATSVLGNGTSIFFTVKKA